MWPVINKKSLSFQQEKRNMKIQNFKSVFLVHISPSFSLARTYPKQNKKCPFRVSETYSLACLYQLTLYCIMRLNNDILNQCLENHFNVKTNHDSVLHESVVLLHGCFWYTWMWDSYVMWQPSAFILSRSSTFHHSIPPLGQCHS